jgi:peptidoglycan hydrolase CwlO-like protein
VKNNRRSKKQDFFKRITSVFSDLISNKTGHLKKDYFKSFVLFQRRKQKMKDKLAEKIRKNEESLVALKAKKLNIERQIENLENKIRNQKFALDNLTAKQKKAEENIAKANLEMITAVFENDEE